MSRFEEWKGNTRKREREKERSENDQRRGGWMEEAEEQGRTMHRRCVEIKRKRKKNERENKKKERKRNKRRTISNRKSLATDLMINSDMTY